jgi:hypothetical protein
MRRPRAVATNRPRGAGRRPVPSAAEAPDVVRRLLKGYDVSTLTWANPDHRYAIVRAILVRGDDQAAHWLGSMLRRNEVRALVRQYRGAGCNEPERRKLRRALRLTVSDIPNRPYLGFEWPSRA